MKILKTILLVFSLTIISCDKNDEQSKKNSFNYTEEAQEEVAYANFNIETHGATQLVLQMRGYFTYLKQKKVKERGASYAHVLKPHCDYYREYAEEVEITFNTRTFNRFFDIFVNSKLRKDILVKNNNLILQGLKRNDQIQIKLKSNYTNKIRVGIHVEGLPKKKKCRKKYDLYHADGRKLKREMATKDPLQFIEYKLTFKKHFLVD